MLLDISPVASFADYFVIASASAPRHFEALADAVQRRIPDAPRPRREGTADSGWVLFDFGDVIVHLFSVQERAYYNLEALWSAATELLRIE